MKRPLLLTASKDNPVLISALVAQCHELLTLDGGDFGIVLGTEVYGMRVSTPTDFLVRAGLGFFLRQKLLIWLSESAIEWDGFCDL